jgi:hypothetical protein
MRRRLTEQTATTFGYHMVLTQLSIPRKRRHSERLAPQQHKTTEHVSKRQKRSHPVGSQFPSVFWDNLSKIHLTERALEELERRNAQVALTSGLPILRSHRPITRSVLAERKKGFHPVTSPKNIFISVARSV